MALLEHLLEEINARHPRLAEVEALLGRIGDFPPYQHQRIEKHEVHFMSHDVMRVIDEACAHYLVDIYNNERQNVLLSLLAHLKKYENHFYIAALFYCYHQFYEAKKRNPQLLELVDIASVFKKLIYNDRLSASYFEKCVTDIPLSVIRNFIVPMVDDDVAVMMMDARQGSISLASDTVRALKIDMDGRRSPYSAYAMDLFFFLGVGDTKKEKPNITKLMSLTPLLKAELGSDNLSKLSLRRHDLIYSLDVSTYIGGEIIRFAFPGIDHAKSPEADQAACFKRYVETLLDLGMIVNLDSPEVQAIFRAAIIACLYPNRELSSAVLAAILKALNIDLPSKFLVINGDKKVNILEYFDSREGYSDNRVSKLAELIKTYLVFDQKDIDEAYEYLNALADFSNKLADQKRLHGSMQVTHPRGFKFKSDVGACKIVISAFAANESVKALGASMRFASLALEKTEGVCSDLSSVMLAAATEEDKSALTKVVLSSNSRRVFSLNLLSGLTPDGIEQLNLDLENGAQSRLAHLIHVEFERDGCGHVLSSNKLSLSSRFLLSLPQAVKAKTNICLYIEALARSGLLFADVMKEISQLCEQEESYLLHIKNNPGFIEFAFGRVQKVYHFLRFVDFFAALPDAMKSLISVRRIVEHYSAIYGRIDEEACRELSSHLTEVHKSELRDLFISCYRRKDKDLSSFYGWFTGQDLSERGDLLAPDQYRGFGIGLDVVHEGRTLLEDPYKQVTPLNTLVLFYSRALHNKYFSHPRRVLMEDPFLPSRIIASSLAGLSVDNGFIRKVDSQDLMSYQNAFISWMMMSEFSVGAWGMDSVLARWSPIVDRLHYRFFTPYEKINMEDFEERSLLVAKEITVDGIVGHAVGLVMKEIGRDAFHGLTRAHLRRAYSTLLFNRVGLLNAFRDKLFLGGSCLLLRILKTPDQGYYADTQEFLAIFEKVKEASPSADAMRELGNRVEGVNTRSPRDAVLYLALNQNLSNEDFDRIARQHLHHDFPLDDENHEAVKSALRLLTKEQIGHLKTKLALLALVRDSGMKLKFNMDRKSSQDSLKNNLLMHIIMAGKTSLDPKKTHVYNDVIKCLKGNLSPLGIYSLFKQPLPAGELGLGGQLQQGDPLLAPRADARRADEAKQRMSMQLNNSL